MIAIFGFGQIHLLFAETRQDNFIRELKFWT
jgi:hypothetical protein